MGTIKINNLTKYYGKVCALNNVSLVIEPNKIYGLLGRNGAGKTTLLNLITNRLFPTEGTITIGGESVIENDTAIGKIFYMTEKNLYPEGLTIKSIFKWTKEFYPSFNYDYALALSNKFDLNINKKIKSLSTGYNTLSKLITTLASNADILIFDEPILGLDAHHRDLFYKELLANFMDNPRTIILSTHIIEEISDILENVIIIKENKILIDQSVESLLKTTYCISGLSENIDKFIEGKQCIGIETMASFKAATILDQMTDVDKVQAKNLNLELTKVGLQKLFIHLTNVGGAEQ